MRFLALASRHRVVIILGLTLIISALAVPGYFSASTLGLGLDRAATIGLIAIGLTVLLVAGQIDLSGGAVFALAGIMSVILPREIGILPAALVGILVGMLAGAINGALVVGLKVNSLVLTLATMLIFRSLAHWITNSQPVTGTDIMLSLAFAKIHLEIFTIRSALFIVLIVLLHVWLTRTIPGRNVFAVGSNPAAAKESGIASDRIVFLGFVFAGTLAGLAGVLQSLVTNTGSPVFGSELTVAVIAAVVVGGTRLEGGKGSALGTLGGVLTIGSLTIAMEFQSVPAYVQQVVSGLILILLVVLDRAVTTKGRAPGTGPALIRDNPITQGGNT
ncbi:MULTISPECIES: ABC transporter permease [unclassified Mesorhizobium]|uniref:ABC transporter permease n=1 Tax=unclassified Mesorhizobium TaxID=325217 RepID=UPI00112C17EF|nr:MULTISPECIES: ABC transporter permease [unclassified Mesorhizobium]TPI57210.1 ABC transporter permease [Mesorhizobium sp. B3-1-1]TPJ72400.1 ABC transporter permease [Mesorhizobium sp. B2-6-7]TPJ89305.1 ABC transporter permease [Mesorhizobium sp. B2-6-3]TPK04405.1 ABC transporter permease [Mesorhizobium sp. B2-5-10]TPK15052.1 ABC transporter permease [Mesorhizobium sp. B2-5-11]